MIHGSGTATTREKDCAYAKDGNDSDTTGADVLKAVPPPVAGLEESPTAPADDILYDARAAEVVHAVDVDGGSRVVPNKKECNIFDEDKSDEIDIVGVNDDATITMEMMGVSLETLPPRFHQDIEPVVAVGGIVSIDNSLARGVFARTRKIMVQRRLVLPLVGNHWKAVVPIVLASIGVALPLLVSITDGNKKSNNDRAALAYHAEQEDSRIVMLCAEEETEDDATFLPELQSDDR